MTHGHSRQFLDKVAVVLGASARGGVGWAVAEGLAAEGAKVVVGARRVEPLQELARAIDGSAVACDICDESQVSELIRTAVQTYGRLDIAVNAAAHPSRGLVANAKPYILQKSIDTNFFGSVYFVRHAAAAMTEGGAIILFSSMSATHPLIPFFPYSCAKAATDCLVKYAAVEYAERGIRINSILPGAISTEMSKTVVFADPVVAAAYQREVPLGRIGCPPDFVNAVLWLAGPAFATGTSLHVSGGNQLTRFPQPYDFAPTENGTIKRTEPPRT
jgi:NAD(P)-dependent dehydrogenase (short-subunit alcohol dehydrogenase family)